MNSPSNIFVKAEEESGSIFVGGMAKIEDVVEL
jgi:hypothetical protein